MCAADTTGGHGLNLSKLTKGEKLVALAGLFLIFDLIVLPWYKINVETLSGIRSASATGIDDPNGGFGVVAVLLCIVLAGQILLSKFTKVQLPRLSVPWWKVHLYGGYVVAALMVLKLLAKTDSLAIGAILGLVAGAAVAYGGFKISKEPNTTSGFA